MIGITADKSGNGHHFTKAGLVATDKVFDSPTNIFATWNSIHNGDTVTPSEGNLKLTTGSSTTEGYYSTIAMSGSGKYYAEFLVGTAGTQNMFGIASNVYNNSGSGFRGGTQYSYALGQGSFWTNGGETGNLTTTFSVGDIFAVAIDLDNNVWYVARNNTWYNSGNPSAGSNGIAIAANNTYHFSWTFDHDEASGVCTVNFGQDSSFAGAKTAQGNQDGNEIGDFFYAPPTGFLALCTKNLPEPAVDPRNHFNTVIYTGDGNDDRSITGVGFQPDFVWYKERSVVRYHGLFDILRGVTNIISSNVTDVEETISGVKSFTTDGFTLGTHVGGNEDGETFVAWNWKAGNANTAFTESGNNPGGIHRANVAAGFSIVSYTGTGAAGTVAHGLGAAPELMLIKNRDVADEWYVYYGDNTDYLVLDDTDATADNATAWNDTSPSSTVFTVNTSHSVNADAEKYIAYCWRSIEGFSKIGTYTGNGAVDGIFNYTGFRPAWVMIKRTDATNYWLILDDARPYGNPNFVSLYANLNDVENTFGNGTGIDFVSNGFKHRDNAASTNADGGTYIFLAFADSPFKYSNGK
jgi:hypothetical protein